MKKRLVLLLTVIIFSFSLLGCVTPQGGYAAPIAASASFVQAPTVEKAALEKRMRDFLYDANGDGIHDAGDRLDRTAFTDGEKAAAEYLKSEFETLGLESSLQSFEVTGGKNTYSSQNVLAVYRGQAVDGATVLLGAHYDNAYGSALLPGSKSHGAYSNATGIAVLLAVAEALTARNAALPFDVIFAAFGAEEAGNFGSGHYVSKLSVTEKNSILLMANFDSVGGGDKLYLFCDDIKTLHEDYMRGKAENLSETAVLYAPPKNKRPVLTSSGSSYAHYGLMSDNLAFLNAGINTATYLSLNWEDGNKFGFVESTTKDEIIGTSSDTLEKLAELYPDYLDKMKLIADNVLAAMSADDFTAVMRQSKEERPNYGWVKNPLWGRLIQFGLILIAAGIIWLLAARWNKKYKRPPVIRLTEELVMPVEVFGTDYSGRENGASGDPPKPNTGGEGKNNPFDGY